MLPLKVTRIGLSLFTLTCLSYVFTTNGQTVCVDDTFIYLDESGRITCRIMIGDASVTTVQWEMSRDQAPSVQLYVYWPSSDGKYPEPELQGRSDYAHHPDGNSTLIIHNATQTDQGNYTCTVHSGDLLLPIQDTGEVLVTKRLETPEITVYPNPVIEEGEVVFLCTPLGNVSMDVQYEFQTTTERNLGNVNINQDNFGILKICNASRYDDGNYTCRVRNPAGPSEWSESVKLDVFYPPVAMAITKGTNNSFLYDGDNVTVSCSVTGGRPFASSVLWDCGGLGSGNGSLISDGRVNSFTATVDKTWNYQNCSCLVNQSALPEISVQMVQFSVFWPPKDPSLSFDLPLPWLENNNFTAYCQTTDVGNPACTYSWFKGNQSLQLQQSENNITLHVTKDDNKKQLKCVLQNLHTQERSAGELNMYTDLNVQFAPLVTFETFGQTISQRENENVTLECVADSNPEPTRQQFVLIHERAGGPTYVRDGENIWTLGPVSKEDAGTYTCHVTVNISHPEKRNLTGQDQRTLVVYYLHVNTSLLGQEVTEYERVDIECTAEAVSQDVVFSPWMHVNRGETVYLNSTFQNHTRAVITFQSIQYNDAGMYRCKAGNSAYQDDDEKTAEQQVIVRYTAKQPKHPVEGLQIYTGLGQNVSLTITIDAYPEEVRFTWSHIEDDNITIIMNDECTLNKDDCLESTYQITDVTMSDLGQYTVHANNSVLNGSDFHFTLIQREGPGTPSIIVSRSFPTPVSVEIWWRANHDGGYTQTFSVHYREPGEDFSVFRSRIPDKGLNVLHHVRVTPLDPATTYQFQVTAHNGHNGETMITSNQEEFRTLMRPLVDNSTLSVSRHGSIAYLIWKRPEGAFDTQRIEQYEITGKRFKRVTRTCTPPTCLEHRNMSTDVTSYNVSGLEEGKKYRFAIVLFYRGDIVQRQEFTKDPQIVSEPVSAGMNAGIIAGSVLSIIFIVTMAAFIIVYLLRRRSVAKGTKKRDVGATRTDQFEEDRPGTPHSGHRDLVDFQFSYFCDENHLTMETRGRLQSEALTSKEALLAMEDRHIQMLSLPVGQDALLTQGINNLKTKRVAELTEKQYEEIEHFNTPGQVTSKEGCYEMLQMDKPYQNVSMYGQEKVYEKLSGT